MSTSIIVKSFSSLSEGLPVVKGSEHFDDRNAATTSHAVDEVGLHRVHETSVEHLLLEGSGGGKLWHERLMILFSDEPFYLLSPFSKSWSPIMISKEPIWLISNDPELFFALKIDELTSKFLAIVLHMNAKTLLYSNPNIIWAQNQRQVVHI